MLVSAVSTDMESINNPGIIYLNCPNKLTLVSRILVACQFNYWLTIIIDLLDYLIVYNICSENIEY